jgi:glycosyltransferase involved in cell wall biosynthesis
MDEQKKVGNGLVSVIMPAYRMGAFIGEALASVGAQTYTNWEVIVVDDHGPEDGTPGIVADFAKSRPGKRVEFIRHPENRGVSAARNTAIAAAQGEFLALLDPDDVWLAGHLANAMALFAKDAHLAVVTGPVVRFRSDASRNYEHPVQLAEWKKKYFPHSLAVHNFIQPSATVLRHADVLSVGGFDCDPQLQHVEDYDLWIRLVKANARFAFYNIPSSRYRKHASAATADTERMALLLERVNARHKEFIEAGRGRMLWRALDVLEMERAVRSGPVLKTFERLDAIAQRLVRRIVS